MLVMKFGGTSVADAERSTHIPDSLRGVQTRVRVLRRVLSVLLAICGGAVMLMQFEVMRSIGVSLLASAGVAGIVLGVAAQRTLGGVVAGIQLSFTQPIRIGDQVVVESEFGTIEEITLTYVVIKVWDERRMIVPVSVHEWPSLWLFSGPSDAALCQRPLKMTRSSR